MRRAAEDGNATAQSDLGERYAQARGVDKSEAEAERWLGKAAAQADQKALRLLLPMLAHDFQVAKDDPKAVEALRKAAVLGDGSARHLLGMAYWMGRGVSRDPVEACMWLILAGAKPEDLCAATGRI